MFGSFSPVRESCICTSLTRHWPPSCTVISLTTRMFGTSIILFLVLSLIVPEGRPATDSSQADLVLSIRRGTVLNLLIGKRPERGGLPCTASGASSLKRSVWPGGVLSK